MHHLLKDGPTKGETMLCVSPALPLSEASDARERASSRCPSTRTSRLSAAIFSHASMRRTVRRGVVEQFLIRRQEYKRVAKLPLPACSTRNGVQRGIFGRRSTTVGVCRTRPENYQSRHRYIVDVAGRIWALRARVPSDHDRSVRPPEGDLQSWRLFYRHSMLRRSIASASLFNVGCA